MKESEAKKLLEQLRKLGVISVLLSGGEIFLRNDIFDIISYAREMHMRVTLLSNASLLDRAKIAKLSKLYVTEFSTTIFSMNPTINDSITKTERSLAAILVNLQLLKEYGIKTKVKMPIMKKNAHCVDDVVAYCNENQFEFMPSFSISLKMDGECSPKNLRIDQGCMQRNLTKIDSYFESVKNKLKTPAKNDPCPAIFCSFSIDCNGDVFPCNSVPYKVGNIFEESVIDIWNHSERLKYIQSIKMMDLEDCIKCPYASDCDPCIGLALLEGKGLKSCDPVAKTVAIARAANRQGLV